jgi:hypothetical protein
MFHASVRSTSLRATVALLALAAVPSLAAAQAALETPAPSPRAKVEQRVGLTDFQVEYSSPAVKGRKVWGELVPLDKVWRTGANAATKLTASRDFTFGDKPVKAGTYSLHSIPGKTSWTVILNSNPNASPQAYDEKLDVARVNVRPVASPAHRERLTFIFSDTTDDATHLDLEWVKVRVRVPLKVDTKAQVAAAIEQADKEAWRPHFTAARYLLESGGDLDRALSFADKSVAIQPTWWNQWVKAQIHGKKGNKAEAAAAAREAQELGKGDQIFEGFFKTDVDKAIASWK